MWSRSVCYTELYLNVLDGRTWFAMTWHDCISNSNNDNNDESDDIHVSSFEHSLLLSLQSPFFQHKFVKNKNNRFVLWLYSFHWANVHISFLKWIQLKNIDIRWNECIFANGFTIASKLEFLTTFVKQNLLIKKYNLNNHKHWALYGALYVHSTFF